MPRISEFYGILIYMYFQDHPPAHFHALYAEHEALVDIESGSVLEGRLPTRAMKLVQEWRELHQAELLEDWRKAQEGEPLDKIEPLD